MQNVCLTIKSFKAKFEIKICTIIMVPVFEVDEKHYLLGYGLKISYLIRVFLFLFFFYLKIFFKIK